MATRQNSSAFERTNAALQRMLEQQQQLHSELQARKGLQGQLQKLMTERDRLNAELSAQLAVQQERTERFRQLVRQVKDYAIFLLAPDGRASSWNEGVAQVLGYAEDEFDGVELAALFVAEDIASGAPAEELARAERHGSVSVDRWLQRKDGRRFWASGMTTALRNDAGVLIGYGKVLRDLTEHKLMEQQLRAAQLKLHEHAQRLEVRVSEGSARLRESLTEHEAFSYSLSHDLRAPLRAMEGYAQYLLDDYGEVLDATGRDYVQRINKAASRLDRLLQDILSYGDISQAPLELRAVELEPLLSELIQTTPELQPPGVEIVIHQPLGRVFAHEPSLVQCLAHLLRNAVKFTPPARRPRIVIASERRGERLRLSITDNGTGIAPEHQQRIFAMFEIAHAESPDSGTGIGLAIVRRGIERMGGSVGVEPAPGEGSRFWLELHEAP